MSEKVRIGSVLEYDVLGDINIAYCLVQTAFRSLVVSLRLFAQHTYIHYGFKVSLKRLQRLPQHRLPILRRERHFRMLNPFTAIIHKL